MEVAIRRSLTSDGFYGNGAKLKNVRLVAVQRPGWLQVYRFEARVRVKPDGANETETDIHDSQPDAEPEYQELLGLVRNDARTSGHDVRVFIDENDRRQVFADWSDEMICLRGAQGLR